MTVTSNLFIFFIIIKRKLINFFHFRSNRETKYKRIIKLLLCLIGILTCYIGYLGYLLYRCMYNEKVVKSIEFNYSTNKLNIVGGAKNAFIPVSFSASNPGVEIYAKNKKMVKLEGPDIEMKQGDQLWLDHMFHVRYFKGSSVLTQFKKIESIDFHVSTRLYIKILFFSISLPIKQKFNYVFGTGGGRCFEIVKHKLKTNILLTDINLLTNITIIDLPNIHFDVHFNKNFIGTILLVQKKPTLFQSQFSFIEKTLGDSVPDLFDAQSISLEFSNFIKTENKGFDYLFENFIKGLEINIKKENSELKLSKDMPILDTFFDRSENGTLYGYLNVHESLLDNFLSTEFYLNKIILPNLNIEVYSMKRTGKTKIAEGVLINNKLDHYLAFNYELKIIDLTTFILQMIASDDKKGILQIKTTGDDVLAQITSKINFLWNYSNNFVFTGKFEMPKIEVIERHTNKAYINNFKFKSKITSDDKNQFESKNEVTLPFMNKTDFEHFQIGWNDIKLNISNLIYKMDFIIKQNSICCIKNFIYLTDIVRAYQIIDFDIIVSSMGNDWSNYFKKIQTDLNKITIPVTFEKCEFAINNTTGKSKNNFNFRIDRQLEITKNKEPSLEKILNKIQIKLENMTKVNEFHFKIRSFPIVKKSEFYNVDFDIDFPELKIGIKTFKFTEPFLDVQILPMNLKFIKTNNATYNFQISSPNDKFYTDIFVVFHLFAYDSKGKNYTTKPSLKMNYYSYFINSFISHYFLRKPSADIVQIENRNLPDVVNVTDEPMDVFINAHFNTKEAVGSCKIVFPETSLLKNRVNVGSKVEWTDFAIRIKKKKEDKEDLVYINMKAGDINIRTDKDTNDYQSNKHISFDFKLPLFGDTRAEEYYFELEKNGVRRDTTFKRTIFDKICPIEKDYKKNEENRKPNYKLNELLRKFSFEGNALRLVSSISFKDYQIISSFVTIITSILSHLNFKQHPRFINLQCNIDASLKKDWIPYIFNFKVNLNTTIEVAYNRKKTDENTNKKSDANKSIEEKVDKQNENVNNQSLIVNTRISLATDENILSAGWFDQLKTVFYAGTEFIYNKISSYFKVLDQSFFKKYLIGDDYSFKFSDDMEIVIPLKENIELIDQNDRIVISDNNGIEKVIISFDLKDSNSINIKVPRNDSKKSVEYLVLNIIHLGKPIKVIELNKGNARIIFWVLVLKNFYDYFGGFFSNVTYYYKRSKEVCCSVPSFLYKGFSDLFSKFYCRISE